jgi:GNAT superfamily N-acetyltransferase
MFRIRRIYDVTTPTNRQRMTQVQAILRAQFSALAESDVEKLPDQLADPLKHRFHTVLFVAEGARNTVRGFALLMHAPDLDFCLLDFLSAGSSETGRGIGGALYQSVREEASALGVVGLFFECWPDDPALSPDAQVRAQNIARLRFYERYGARPIDNTLYATPLDAGGVDPPYLVFDGLGARTTPGRGQARKIVRAILKRKYGKRCSPEYVDLVVKSFNDDPIQLRPPRYTRTRAASVDDLRPKQQRIALIVSDKHQIHHVRERGYVEAPVRIPTILEELAATQLFETVQPERFPIKHIEAVLER